MNKEMTKKLIIVLTSVLVLIAGIFIVISSIPKTGEDTLSETKAETLLNRAINKVSVTENYANKGTVTYEDSFAQAELPDINKAYPMTLDCGNKDIKIEIFVSPEKAGTGTDGWMLELAKNFNNENRVIDGRSVGISIRSISSGAQLDYIKSNVYTPDAISPSAKMWGEMLEDGGIEVTTILDKTVGNVAGVIIANSVYSTLETEYGVVDLATIVKATSDGKITTGYTNPFTSTTGLNFLASALYSMDKANPLSNTAIEGFNDFQNNVPFVAYTTLQMRNAAENGTFTCFVNEYQTYYNDATMRNNYKFIPYGIRHDNPLYAIGTLSTEKIEGLKLFADYCSSVEAINKAKEYGFNQMDTYVETIEIEKGSTWVQLQRLWKQNKNTAKPIAAVFVLDTSGSMSGEPIVALKNSLRNSMKYINSTNYVGVISYSSDINIALPIGLFDISQQAYFNGAVDGLSVTGNTATYSAVAQAVKMLNEFMIDNPNVQPMIFLLSDGQSNLGAELKDVRDVIKFYEIPIYTIGYNANLAELKAISEINEAASINERFFFILVHP